MPWDKPKTARLVQRWAEGASQSVIGREIGMSKSAVGHRVVALGLPPRSSPIVRDGVIAPPRPPRRPHSGQLIGSTLPPLPSDDDAAS